MHDNLKFEDKTLLIGVLTKNHSEYIQCYLSEILDEVKRYNVDIGIYDSSTDEKTKEIVLGKIKDGYDNLFYKQYDPDILIGIKGRDLYINSGYQYIWPCGDGVIPKIAKIYEIIKKEMKVGRDCIVFDGWFFEPKDAIFKIFDDVNDFIEMAWSALTLLGGTVLKGNLYSEEEYTGYVYKYKMWFPNFGLLEHFSNIPFNGSYCRCGFQEYNPYKLTSTWMQDGLLVEYFAGEYVKFINKLPAKYSDKKKNIYLKLWKDLHLFRSNRLLRARYTGNLNVRKVLKYHRELQKVTREPFFKIIFISVLPVNIVKLLTYAKGDW